MSVCVFCVCVFCVCERVCTCLCVCVFVCAFGFQIQHRTIVVVQTKMFTNITHTQHTHTHTHSHTNSHNHSDDHLDTHKHTNTLTRLFCLGYFLRWFANFVQYDTQTRFQFLSTSTCTLMRLVCVCVCVCVRVCCFCYVCVLFVGLCCFCVCRLVGRVFELCARDVLLLNKRSYTLTLTSGYTKHTKRTISIRIEISVDFVYV